MVSSAAGSVLLTTMLVTVKAVPPNENVVPDPSCGVADIC
jgi:hypothetical protein